MKKSTRHLVLLSISVLVLLRFTASAQELSEEEVKKANNPLANAKAFNLQNYYVPSIYEDANLKANSMFVRFAMPFAGGKILMRATLPLATNPSGYAFQNGALRPTYSSGLGDFNFFATYTFSKPGAKTMLGIGPQVVIPTASTSYLGAGKWQLGGALVAFNASSLAFQWGALVTYQTSVGGDENRPETSLLVLQPFLLFQLGKGTYLRSTALWNFNLQTESYNVPLGFGAGQVVKVNKAVFNIFLEPQFTFLHQGTNQPALQIFAGVNMQF